MVLGWELLLTEVELAGPKAVRYLQGTKCRYKRSKEEGRIAVLFR